MKTIIRKAKKTDLEFVHKLVVELAIYEKEPDAVTATLDDYEQAFSEGIFEVLIAERDNQIVGIALYYMTYSTWKGKMLYLEDFVVQEKYRHLGIGQSLFDAFKKEGKKKGAVLLKWQVLDWNTVAIRFYEKNNATLETDWINCKYYLSDNK